MMSSVETNRDASNPVAHTRTSASIRAPDRLTTPSGVTNSTDSSISVTFGPAQSLVPPVVQQDSLSVGRVVGQAFLKQLGSAPELLPDVSGEELAMAIVLGVHGPLRVRPRQDPSARRRRTLSPSCQYNFSQYQAR